MVLGLVIRRPVSTCKYVWNFGIDHACDSRRRLRICSSSNRTRAFENTGHVLALEIIGTIPAALEHIGSFPTFKHLIHAHTLENVAVEDIIALHKVGHEGSGVTALELITGIKHFG